MTTNSILTDIGDVEIYIGTYGDKWVAATGHEPYFCLEADSLVDLDSKILRLVAFAKQAKEQLHGNRERGESKTFTLKKKILVRELENA
jgi:hypothetical protein